MRSPHELQDQLDSYLTQMDEAGKGMDEALELLVNAEDEWETVYDDFLADLTEDHARSEKRLPGEDVRVSMCRQEHRDTWRLYRRAERSVTKFDKRISRLRTQVSGIQTELRMLKDEAGAGVPSPSSSGTGG